MADYIDREKIFSIWRSMPAPASVTSLAAAISQTPTANVVEVRHGHWIDLNAENSTGPLFKCSECSHLHNPNRNDLDLERVELNPLYCDACGARMDKEDEHEAG